MNFATNLSVRLTLSLGLACLAALPASVQGQDAAVSGTVVDQEGVPLPGVRIELATDGGDLAASAFSDETGAFRIAVAPGAYTLMAELSGFEDYEEPVDVGEAGAVVQAELAIRPFAQTITVSGTLPDVAFEQLIPARQIEQRVAQDLALSLREQAGVTALRRGSVNLDPSVRGLYAEQIGIFVDGTRTFAAGPARMDSALSHVSPHSLQSVSVVRGPFALTWGAGTLSAIKVDTFRPAFEPGNLEVGGRVGYNYGENGGTSDGYVSLWGSSERFRFTLKHNSRLGNDYKDGNGSEVAGDYESFETMWSLGGRLSDGTVLEYAGGYQQQNDLDYPGRILDATYFRTNSHAVELTHTRANGPVTEFAVRAYVNDKSHRMNNHEKPTALDMPGRMPPFGLEIDLPAETTTTGARMHVEMGRGDLRSKVGLDTYRVEQNAERTIMRRSNGFTLFQDAVWPDARVENTGAYGQLIYSMGRATLGGTVRVDQERARVGEVTDFFLANTDGDLSQKNTSVSAAGSLNVTLAEGVVLSLGAGQAVRSPSVLERYSDRFPAVKFQTAAEFMGTPSLVPETSREVSAGLIAVTGNFTFEADLFHRTIDDYITVAPDPTLGKRLPLSPPVVFRYVQSDEARFVGGDLRVEYGFLPWLVGHGTLSYVRAEDTRFDEPLFGIPGREHRLGLRAQADGGERFVEVVMTTQADQDRVATARFEAPTEGWTTVDLHGGFRLANRVRLRAGVMNLTDEFYVNHLNSFNPFTRMRIAELGRSAYVGAEYSF